MTTLPISDLSISQELDGKAMTAVRGGEDDQAIGTSQANVQKNDRCRERRQRLVLRRPDDHPVGQHLHADRDPTNSPPTGLVRPFGYAGPSPADIHPSSRNPQLFLTRTDMTTLHISDLSISNELDGEAMTAVRGGAGQPGHRHEPSRTRRAWRLPRTSATARSSAARRPSSRTTPSRRTRPTATRPPTWTRSACSASLGPVHGC